MNERIKCQICGKECKQIHHKHVKQHGLTIDKYKEMFPDAPINSKSSSLRRRNAALGREIKGHADAADDWSCDCRRCDRDRLKMILFTEQYCDRELDIIGRKEYAELATKYCNIVSNWEKSSWDQLR